MSLRLSARHVGRINENARLLKLLMTVELQYYCVLNTSAYPLFLEVHRKSIEDCCGIPDSTEESLVARIFGDSVEQIEEAAGAFIQGLSKNKQGDLIFWR